MALTLEQCRRSLAESGKRLTDEQVLELRDTFAVMAEIIAASYLRQRHVRTAAVDSPTEEPQP